MRTINLIPWVLLVILGLSMASCSSSNSSPTHSSNNSPVKSSSSDKATSQLILQVSLRRQQLVEPNSDRLAQMQAQGINTSDLEIQRIYIYFKEQLTQTQIDELQALGIKVYLNSWIPPAGNNPDGFYLADLPVDKLDALADQDYVVRIDTAEKLSHPQ
jgi:hypothetical protein